MVTTVKPNACGVIEIFLLSMLIGHPSEIHGGWFPVEGMDKGVI
jgi:hypothetical protein